MRESLSKCSPSGFIFFLFFLFRIVFDDLDVLMLVQIDDLILRDANERMRRKVFRIADEDALETVAQGDGRAEEHMLTAGSSLLNMSSEICAMALNGVCFT